MTRRASPSHQSDNDLLTEIAACAEELPMSLAWFRRKRVQGAGRRSFGSPIAFSTAVVN